MTILLISPLEKKQKKMSQASINTYMLSISFEKEAHDGICTNPTRNINGSKNGTPSKKLYKCDHEHVNKILIIILKAL